MVGAAVAPTLPKLVAVTCPECGGDGYHESFSDLGVDHSRRCETCFGAGEVEVCGGCKKLVDVLTDRCGCNRVDPEVLWAIQAGMTTAEQVGMS